MLDWSAMMPQLFGGLQLGYQTAPAFEAFGDYFALDGEGFADLTLGLRLTRWAALFGHVGFGAWRLRDRLDRPRNDVTTMRLGAGLRLTWPLSRYVRPYGELRAGWIWLGEGEDGHRGHPQQLALPQGLELVYGGGLEVLPLGTPFVTFTLRVMQHQLRLEGPRGFVDGNEATLHRASYLSIGAGFSVSIPLVAP
jgi:hypothetical protein